jgi:hypothetical protein
MKKLQSNAEEREVKKDEPEDFRRVCGIEPP